MFTRASASFFSFLSLAALVNAHFHIQYPEPRGVFVDTNQPTFCDGYTDAVSNRSLFPLHGGYITLTNGHPTWTASVLISIEQNPNDFADFNRTSSGVDLPYAVPFFQGSGAGQICIPVDVGNLDIAGVGDGTNVTLQVMFAGADGNLFQCTDLTLAENFTIPSDVNCTNVVGNGTASSTATTPSSTSSSAANQVVVGASGVLGMIAAALLSL